MNKKQLIREKFRTDVFKRDNYCCRMCGDKAVQLDAHHICDRNLIPNGGYVKENGISLCPDCHIKAEIFHSTGERIAGWTPEDLYIKINSNYQLAFDKSLEKLK